MNILILCFGLYKGGAETQLFSTINNIYEDDENKHRFIIACLKDDSTFDYTLENIDVPVYTNLMKNKFDIFVLLRLFSIMRKHKIGRILVVGSTTYDLPISVLLGIMTRTPVIAQYDVTDDVLIPF